MRIVLRNKNFKIILVFLCFSDKKGIYYIRGIKMFCRRRYYRTLAEGEITIQEFKNKLKQGASLLDVRSKQEYSEGHIKVQ